MDAKATVEGVEVSTLHWIGGERVASASRSAVGAAVGAATFADVSPVDETVIAEVASGGPADAERAVAAARSAFPGWATTPSGERARLLQAVADGVDAQVERLAVVETRDNGSLLRSLRRSVMPRVARNFRFFADQRLALTGSSGAERQAFEQDGHRSRVAWDPAGVTAVVTPWNAPLMLATWRVAPALAAGDTVVLKPPEWAPLTASLLADVARDAGLPDGVLNVLQGTGEEAGAALVAHPGVDRVAFTGSAATGRLVAQAAGANLTPVSLELGGKSPLLVFADADLDAAVGQAANQYDNAGQVCLAGTRLLVEEPVYDEFVERLSAAAKTSTRATRAPSAATSAR
jgi:acyl-CoA reductase-like NAD-dependent aldehyde dehydrogenase